MAEYTNIKRALEKRLATMVGIPATGGVPRVAWENTPFEIPKKLSWLRAVMTPISRETSGIGIGAPILTRGLFLIDVYVPDSKGSKEADDISNDVINRFSHGLALTEASNQVIILKTRRLQGISDAPWYFVPIEVEWYTHEIIN